MDSQNTNNQSVQNVQSLISQADKDAVFQELNLQNLPEDKKKAMMDKMIDTVLGRIFIRLEPNLTEDDKSKLDELEKQPNPDQAITQYIVSRFPNMDEIVKEEIIKYKEELKLQINTIIDVLDQEAAKLPADNQAPVSAENDQTPQPEPQNSSSDTTNTQPV